MHVLPSVVSYMHRVGSLLSIYGLYFLVAVSNCPRRLCKKSEHLRVVLGSVSEVQVS